jgi:hypothetical protein
MKNSCRCVLLPLVIAYGLPLWADEGVKIQPDIVYGHKDGMALTLDVFKPVKPNGAGHVFNAQHYGIAVPAMVKWFEKHLKAANRPK